MAISLNGSTNVITGVAVGGLPDGIVDTDMLAANAVSSAKLASGAGGVAVQTQVQLLSPPTQVSSTSTTYAETGLTKTITPTSASNKIKITANFVAWIDSVAGSNISQGAGIQGQLQMTRTIGGTATVLGVMDLGSWCAIEKSPMSFVAWDTTYNSTATVTYSVQFRRRDIYSGNQAVYVHRTTYTTIATLTLTEYSG